MHEAKEETRPRVLRTPQCQPARTFQLSEKLREKISIKSQLNVCFFCQSKAAAGSRHIGLRVRAPKGEASVNISTNRLTGTGGSAFPTGTQPLPHQGAAAQTGTAASRQANIDSQSVSARDVAAGDPVEVNVESVNLTSALELGSEATGKVGSKLKVDGLGTLSGALATPGAVLHLLQTGSQLIRNPDDIVRQAGMILDNPVETAQDAWDAISQTKDAAETILGAAELGRDAVVSAAGSIKQNGAKAGLSEAGQNLKALARKNYTEFRENISSTTGGGLTHAGKELAALTESRTTRQVTKALSEHLYANPELAPKGLFARARRGLGNLVDAGSERLMGVANGLADRAAGALARSPVGQGILNGLDALNPARHVPESVLTAAAKEGTAKGLAAGTEAVVNSLKKAGHDVATDASGAITRIVSKSGQEIAVEGLQAVTQAGVQAAVREGAEVGVKAAAKGVARFAPGVNVALAAYDVVRAGQVWADPKASGWQKGLVTVTAIGSIAAATNIPIVSQVGAGIALASSVLENIPPAVLLDAGKAVGRGVANAGRAVGRGVSNAGRAVLSGASSAVSAIGGGLKKIGGWFS